MHADHPAELALLMNPWTLQTAPPAPQCAVGVATWTVAAALPEEQAAIVTAHLLRSSAGAR